MKIVFGLIVALFLAGSVQGQDGFIGYGFRAGLSFARIDGPWETDNGNELERSKMSTGFHIGLTVNFKFTDIMGLRTELLYSQRGTDYFYEGPSYFILGRNSLQPVILDGTRNQTVNVSNSYLDIPLTAYYKLGYFELSAGLNTGILIGSSGGGSIEFTGVSPSTQDPLVPFTVNLNHSYESDEAGEASPVLRNLSIDGINYQIPEYLGAYYDFDEKDKDLYKTLDFGITAGLAYYLNDGLYIGAKYIHGLNDVDRNEYDISLKELSSNGEYIQRDDNNKSKSIQLSIGFNF